MKHFLLLLFFTPLFFLSCSSDDALTSNNEAKMLDSYVIKRNANGSYTLKHVVYQGVNTVYNDDEKNNNVILYFDGKATQTEFNRNYLVTNKELNINFSTENNTYQPQIKLLDDNTGQRSDFGLLNDYEIVQNADGSVTVNYVVEAGVKVVYGFDAAENINEIRLEKDSNATQTNYSKTYIKDNNTQLKIDFIQPENNKVEDDTDRKAKKPRIIIET